MASLVPSPFLAASKSEHQLSSLSQKHFFLHSFIPKRTQIAISSKSSIKVKCAAIGNGLFTQTSPEVRRVVPDNTNGLPTVKIVYVVLEAQYQSSLTAAVQALNKNRVHANFEVVGYLVEELRDESTYRTFCKDLEDANVFIGSLIFVEELALKVKAAVEKERERLDAVLVFPSMPEVMRLNKLGSFSMSQLGQSKSPFFQLFKKKKQSAGFADSMLKLVRTLPKVLKYLPSDKAQDARLYILSLQFWLGGSPDNLQNFLKMISGSYVPALKGAKIEYSDPVLYLDSGIWHPLAPCMYDDVKEYLNWYGTRSDANEKLSACLGPHFWKPGFWKTPRFWMLVFGHQVWENTRLGFPKHPFLLPYTPFSQHPVSVTRFLSLSLVSFPRLSSSLPFLSRPFARIPSAAFLPSESSYNLHNNVRFTSMEKPANSFTSHSASSSSPCSPVLQKSIALAASISLLMWPTPANAGFLSGFSGIESVPGPQLPQIDFLNRFNEENQKKYAEADARFKSSPLLKELLERSKLNKEKNRQKIVDKYCIRGAEWGVGDCSAEGMSPEERENFISMLKRKAGVD